MTGHGSGAQDGRLARPENAARWWRRRPLLIAGALGAGGTSGAGLYLLAIHGAVPWLHADIPTAAAAGTGISGFVAAIVLLATHLVRLAQERKEGQVRIDHERRAGDLMLEKVETLDEAREIYKLIRGTKDEGQLPGKGPDDPADLEIDPEALTAS
jgi:hypothetical protein